MSLTNIFFAPEFVRQAIACLMSHTKKMLLFATLSLITFAAPFATAAENSSDSPPGVRFTIKGYALTGNSKIPSEQLQKIILPYTGESKSFDTIEQAVTAIEKAYKQAGYDAVRVLIPKQEIEDDIVRLEVVEAKIGRILVEGNKNYNADNIRRSLPSLKEGAVPDVTQLGMNLRLANESFSKQTQVTFRQGTDPRSMDAVASVSDNKPLYTAITLDNTGTDPTGEWRLGFALLHNNFLNRDHTLTAQYVTSPGHWSDVKIFGLGYSIPLYSLDGTLDLSASHSSVNSGQVSTTSGNYNISGSGDNFGIHYTQLLPRWGEWDQRLSVGIDDKFFHSSVTTTSTSSSQVPDVEVHPVFLSYTGKIKGPQRELGIAISGFHNFPMGNKGDQHAIHQSRKNASATYNLLKIDTNLTQTFQSGWKLHGELNAQLTSDA